MNITEVVEISILFLQIVVLIYVIYESAKMMKIENNGPFPAFFTFAMIGLLLSNMYGVIFNILRPGKRMPFAVDEIAECASILLISAGLEVIIKKYKKINIGALVFSFLFIACNIALWIVWSGEWVQDIIFGLPYIYFMYLLIIGLKNSDAVSRLEMYLAAVLSFIILIFYTINVFMTGTTKIVIDLVCVFFEFIITGWLFAKCFLAMKHSGDEEHDDEHEHYHHHDEDDDDDDDDEHEHEHEHHHHHDEDDDDDEHEHHHHHDEECESHHGGECTCGCHHHHHHHGEGEAEEYGIGTFVYYARKPFDISLFDDFVARRWPKSVIRAKGLCWFEDQPHLCYIFEQAGRQVQLQNAGQWYATMPEAELEQFRRDNPGVNRDWDDTYGDRQQKIVFIGQHLDKKAITEELDKCLTEWKQS